MVTCVERITARSLNQDTCKNRHVRRGSRRRRFPTLEHGIVFEEALIVGFRNNIDRLKCMMLVALRNLWLKPGI